MRVLHLLHYSPIGGIESYTRDLFSALETRGHENVLIYSGSPLPGLERRGRSLYHLPGRSGQEVSLGAELVEPVSGIIAEAVPDLAYVHTALNPLLAERILNTLPTVYFAHNYAALCPGGALLYERSDSVCTLRGVPDWRCLANAYLQRCNSRRPARLWGTYQHTQRTGAWVRRADAIICDSEYVRRRHVENGFSAERTHVLPSPVPMSPRWSSVNSREESIILFVGRVTPQKGLGYLIRAMTMIEPPSRLVVAGEGYELAKQRTLAAELGVAHRVSFLGAVDREVVRDLYARATVLVVPSVWPEPFGMVGPEAMSYGLPVVAFRVGGIPEWLDDGETGLLVEPKHVRGLADGIQTLLNDRALAQRLGARGRQIAEERFTLDRHADALLALFQEVIETRRKFVRDVDS